MLILRFWNHVAEMLKKLEKDTFIGRDLMDDLEDFKEIFVDSITEAEKVLTGILHIQGKKIF